MKKLFFIIFGVVFFIGLAALVIGIHNKAKYNEHISSNDNDSDSDSDSEMGLAKVFQSMIEQGVSERGGDSVTSAALALNEEGFLLYQIGKTQEALRKLSEAIELEPDNKIFKKNMSILYVSLGKKELENKNYSNALSLFNNALKYDHLDGNVYALLGNTYHRLHQRWKAIKNLETAIRSGYTSAETNYLLGIQYYQENEMDKSRQYLKNSLLLDPSYLPSKQILAKLDRESSVERDLEGYESYHFLLKYDGAWDRTLMEKITLILEDAYFKVGRDFDYYPDEKIPAIIYKEGDFKRVFEGPSWVSAFFDGKIRIPGVKKDCNCIESDGFRKIILHEYTHALIRVIAGCRCPAWLNEGLAQYEEGKVEEDFGDTYLSFIRWDRPIPLRELDGSFLGYDKDWVNFAYFESLSITRYLISRFGLNRVIEFLFEIGEGGKSVDIIEKTLGISYSELERDWFDEFRRGRR